MSTKPTSPMPTTPAGAARLTLERLGDRVLPAILNPQVAVLPAAVVGTPLAADLTVARFQSPDPADGLSATVSINGAESVPAGVEQSGVTDTGVPEYEVRLIDGTFTPTTAGAAALGFVVTIRDSSDNSSERVSGRADVLSAPPPVFPGSDTTDGTVTVTDAEAEPALTSGLTSLVVPPLATTVGVPLNDVTVATFLATNTQAQAGDFTATVNWGDGTTVAATVVSTGLITNGKNFAVVADHKYTSPLPGNRSIVVTVNDVAAATSITSSGALSVSEVSVQPVALTDQQYVRSLYLNELGRAGADSEINGWVQVMGGANGRTAVANAIARSPEARTRLVEGWYETFLNRTAKPAEAQAWTSLLLQGQREEQVLGGILGSAEFAARSQSIVSSGTAQERVVRSLYTSLLGRTASASEVTAWVSVMPQLGTSTVATGFLTSTEYRTQLFAGYYDTFLHRPADTAGLKGWVNSGLDITTVRTAIQAAA